MGVGGTDKRKEQFDVRTKPTKSYLNHTSGQKPKNVITGSFEGNYCSKAGLH